MDWFLYDNGLRHVRVKDSIIGGSTIHDHVTFGKMEKLQLQQQYLCQEVTTPTTIFMPELLVQTQQ